MKKQEDFSAFCPEGAEFDDKMTSFVYTIPQQERVNVIQSRTNMLIYGTGIEDFGAVVYANNDWVRSYATTDSGSPGKGAPDILNRDFLRALTLATGRMVTTYKKQSGFWVGRAFITTNHHDASDTATEEQMKGWVGKTADVYTNAHQDAEHDECIQVTLAWWSTSNDFSIWVPASSDAVIAHSISVDSVVAINSEVAQEMFMNKTEVAMVGYNGEINDVQAWTESYIQHCIPTHKHAEVIEKLNKIPNAWKTILNPNCKSITSGRVQMFNLVGEVNICFVSLVAWFGSSGGPLVVIDESSKLCGKIFASVSGAEKNQPYNKMRVFSAEVVEKIKEFAK
ncbi:methionine tRS [Acrasis kona]|uniref:Methionine tRS n=1 Tax=Acrasis kona TaxID=1008807 RepID=A0AAW2YYV4_9EUKA